MPSSLSDSLSDKLYGAFEDYEQTSFNIYPSVTGMHFIIYVYFLFVDIFYGAQ